MTTRAVIYTRISMTSEVSVSLARQEESCRKYAEARGWEVVDVFTDDGVSATHNKPEDRKGWSALLADKRRFDVVVVWKVDRLARRVLDFLNADSALQERGAAVVAVEDPVDMSTAQGRAFAVVLSVFGELEAASIRARVIAAREHIIRSGRVPARMAPYGYRIVPNPYGPGKVLAQDDDRIGWVREAAEKVLRGGTVHSVMKWLNDEGAPPPRKDASGWAVSSVERVLRNPTLAGMTPYNPGRKRNDAGSWTGVLRGEDGMPVIDESLAILSTDEHRRLVAALDNKTARASMPRASRMVTSELLSRAVWCGECGDRYMSRGTTKRSNGAVAEVLKCKACHQTVSRPQLEAELEARLLAERGHLPMYKVLHAAPDDEALATRLGDIEDALRTATSALMADDADVAALTAQIASLKALRTEARDAGDAVAHDVYADTGETVASTWLVGCETDADKRDVLLSQAERIELRKGRVGRKFDTDRLTIAWKPETVEVVR